MMVPCLGTLHVRGRLENSNPRRHHNLENSPYAFGLLRRRGLFSTVCFMLDLELQGLKFIFCLFFGFGGGFKMSGLGCSPLY